MCPIPAILVDWAVGQLRCEHASINGLARQTGCDWHTFWTQVEQRLTKAAARPRNVWTGSPTWGSMEHIWHHSPRPGKEPRRS